MRNAFAHVTLLHNPTAGSGEPSREEIENRLREAGFEITYCSTKSDGLQDVLQKPTDLFLIAGGDGTIEKVLSRLSSSETPFTILPLGTANNTAHSLGISADLSALIDRLHRGILRPFSLGCARRDGADTPFVEAVGLGALATTLAAGGEERAGEDKLATGRTAFADELARAQGEEVMLVIDGEARSGKWLVVEILNHRYTGPRLPVVATETACDGTFSVFCLTEAQRDDMLDWLQTDRKAPAPALVYRARRIEFDWAGRMALRIDDELQEPPDGPVQVRVAARDGQLRVLVPPAD